MNSVTILYILFYILALWQLILLIIPTQTIVITKTKKNWLYKWVKAPEGNAYNTFVFGLIPTIVIYPDDLLPRKNCKSILAQEIYEINLRRLIPLSLAIKYIPAYARYVEIKSHTIEVVESRNIYGYNIESELEKESIVMVNWYKSFKNKRAYEIQSMMRNKIPEARKWVNERREYLDYEYEIFNKSLIITN